MPGFELISNKELEQIQDVFARGGVLFRQGFDNIRNGCYKVKEFEEAFANNMEAHYALAVTSGTAALRVALAALDIGPGDEVITQSFTFVATIEAIVEAGATPVCVDIDETLNVDPAALEKAITSKTKAVIPVHMLGVPSQMKRILDICNAHNIPVIEDTAWGCGGKLENKYLGTWGRMGAFSFDFAKTMTTGEGGMILFQEEKDYKKAAAWHDHGHENNPTVPRWEDTRSGTVFNYRMMELQGAVGLAQLEKLPDIVHAQQENHAKIHAEISKIAGLTFRHEPNNSECTSDALVFFAEKQMMALKIRDEIVKEGLGTKILPEAYTWHFAGCFEHIASLNSGGSENLRQKYIKSHDILSKAVSIPIFIQMDADIPKRYAKAVKKAMA